MKRKAGVTKQKTQKLVAVDEDFTNLITNIPDLDQKPFEFKNENKRSKVKRVALKSPKLTPSNTWNFCSDHITFNSEDVDVTVNLSKFEGCEGEASATINLTSTVNGGEWFCERGPDKVVQANPCNYFPLMITEEAKARGIGLIDCALHHSSLECQQFAVGCCVECNDGEVYCGMHAMHWLHEQIKFQSTFSNDNDDGNHDDLNNFLHNETVDYNVGNDDSLNDISLI